MEKEPRPVDGKEITQIVVSMPYNAAQELMKEFLDGGFPFDSPAGAIGDMRILTPQLPQPEAGSKEE